MARVLCHSFQGGKPTGYVLNIGCADSKAWAKTRPGGSVLSDCPVVVVVDGARMVELIVNCRLVLLRRGAPEADEDNGAFMADVRALVSHCLPAAYSHLWPALPVEA
jgi:hypothetical protein